jgi:predicted thioesterase
MFTPLRAGLVRTETLTVDRDRTIGFLGEADRVYSTPSMVNDVEYACWRLLQQHIDPAQTSLGVQVSLQHLGPTPLGEEVTVAVRVDAVARRRVDFSAEVTDRTGVVGRGQHQRVLVDLLRHRERLAQRRGLPAAPGIDSPR